MVFINTLIYCLLNNDCQSFDQGNEDHTAVLLGILSSTWVCFSHCLQEFLGSIFASHSLYYGTHLHAAKPSFAGGNDE